MLATWPGTFSQQGIVILLPLHLAWDFISAFPLARILLVCLSILPAWLLANQHFMKPIRVTNLYSVQEHYPTADLQPCLSMTDRTLKP